MSSNQFYHALLIGLLCISLPSNVWSSPLLPKHKNYDELGNPVIEVFDGARFDGEGTNWYMEQHPNGMMFLANSNGLYSFEGAKWRKHPQSGPGHINQFTIVKENIYVGLKGDLGIYTTLPQGDMSFKSLLSELPSDKRQFGSIRNVFQFEGRIVFISAEQIMAYHPELGFKIYSPQHHFRRAWLAGDRLFATDGDGLIYLEKNQIHSVDVLPVDGIGRIGFVQTLGQGFLIGTMENGVFLWHENKLTPWIGATRTEAAYLPYNSLHVNNEILAIATLRNGVIFVDHDGQLIYHLNKANGLPADTTLHLFLDQQQGLWLSHQAYVSRVQLPFELSIFKSEKQDIYSVNQFVRHNGKLYFAAISGLMSIQQNGDLERLQGVNTSGQDMISAHGNLLLAGATQCQIYNPQSEHVKTLLNTAKCNDLLKSKSYPNALFMATGAGIYHSLWNGKGWSEPSLLLQEHAITSKMLEDDQGQIWLANKQNQLIRIYLQENKWEVEKIDFIDQSLTPLLLDGKLLISNDRGFFYWDSQNNQLSERVNWFYQFFGPDAQAPLFLQRDQRKRIWLSNSAYSGFVILKDQQVEYWDNSVSTTSGMHNLRTVFSDDDKTWLGYDKGIVRFSPRDLDRGDVRLQKVKATISEVYNKNNAEILSLNLFGNNQQTIESAYIDTNLRVFFSLSQYVQRKNNQFRYRLNNRRWSSWSTERHADLGQLSSGHYELKMQGRDPQANIYNAQSQKIYINPPWYSSNAAFAFYAICTIAVLGFTGWLSQRLRTANLTKQNILLETQVSQRTAEVESKAAQLEQQQLLKDRFFANVSHEFRTPLTLTIGPLQSLLEDKANQLDDAAKSLANTALNNANKMLALVGQVLDLNRLEADKLPLHVGHYNIAELLRNLQQRFAYWAKQENQQIICRNCIDPLYLYLDLDQIDKSVSNLLSNAIKYSGKGSNITMELSQTDSEVTLQVMDDGYGIKPEDQNKVFERFYQAQNSETVTTPGTGIGLSLVKEIIELHHGTVTLTSRLDQGCCFSIKLKKGKAHFSRKQLVEPISVTNTQPMSSAQVNTLGLINDNDLTTLLIVDDNNELRHFISLQLSDNYKIIQAENGEQGLAAACEYLPDLIVSDVMMPIMTGIEMTQKLKSIAATQTIPIILLTAKSTKRETVEGFNAGADDYLTKPFDTSELVMRVNSLINARKLIRQKVAFEITSKKLNIKQQSPLSDRITLLIEQHLSTPGFGVEDLAEKLHLTRKTLTRKCNAEIGMPPQTYINKLRMHHASNLLLEGKLTISEIAYALGYESLAHFSRSFKKHTGKSPSQLK